MSRISTDDLHILLIEPSTMQRKIIMHQLEDEQVMAIVNDMRRCKIVVQTRSH